MMRKDRIGKYMKTNTNERLLFELLNEVYPKKWEMEAKGINGRKFRFDCANVSEKIAIEIEGGIWLGARGGHTNGIGYSNNMEKYNLAVLEGWKVLRYSPETLKKTPWKIIKDVRILCGGSPVGQKLLCFDDASTGIMQMQTKLG